MFLQITGIVAILLFIFFGVKHLVGLRKVQSYLKAHNDEFLQDHESGLVKISTTSGNRNSAAYECIWSQRFSEHKDKSFVLLCSQTFKSGLYCITAFVIIILCM